MLPPHVADAVTDASLVAAPGSSFEALCEAAVFHSPRPMVVHEIEIDDGYQAMLCGTCADKVLLYRDLLKEHGKLDYAVIREFGRPITALVHEALGVD